MAFTKTNENAANGVTGAEWTTGADAFALGFTSTVGRLLSLYIRDFDVGITWTVAGGGTWVSAGRTVDVLGGNAVTEQFFCVCNSAVTSIDITGSDNGFGYRVYIAEWDGNDASPFDDYEDDNILDTASIGVTPDVTTTVNPALLIGTVVVGGGGSPDLPAGYTSLVDAAAANGERVFWREVTTPGNYNFSSTITGGDTPPGIASLAAFKGSGGGGGPASPVYAFPRWRSVRR